MAVDMFLKLDGIPGESADDKHKGEISIESFSWGASNSGSAAHGGGGAGKVAVQDFSFTTPVSKASPKLFIACATGEHIKSALLTVRRSGERQVEFLKITMTDVLVSSWKEEGSSEAEVPMDQVTMNFSKIQVSYIPQRADGSTDNAVGAGYDVKANVKI